MSRNATLRDIVAERRAVIAPGAANALFARIIEDQGFEVVYATGAGVANMHLGAPDIGLTSVTEMVGAISGMAEAVALPIVADGDTGFGNALNTYRTVRLYERVGASAIQLEDQVFPKKCGHFSGKGVIPAAEMVQKIRAAIDARLDGDFQIIARTDALATEGVDAAIARARDYAEAGADITFVEAPEDIDTMQRICTEIDRPQMANIVFGGKTPDPGNAKLRELGVSLVLYANAALQAAVRGSAEVLASLKETGSLDAVAERLANFEERQRVVDKGNWDAMDLKYRS